MVYHTRKRGLRNMLSTSVFTAYLAVGMSSLLAGVTLMGLKPKPETVVVTPPKRNNLGAVTRDEYVNALVPLVQRLHRSYHRRRLDPSLARHMLEAHYDASVAEKTPLIDFTSMCFYVESKADPQAKGNRVIVGPDGTKRPNPNPALGYCQMKPPAIHDAFQALKRDGHKAIPVSFDEDQFLRDIRLQAAASNKYMRLGMDVQVARGKGPSEVVRLGKRNYQKGIYSRGTGNTAYIAMVNEGSSLIRAAIRQYRARNRTARN